MDKKAEKRECVTSPEEEEVYLYGKAASGRLVRIPASQYENWAKAQEQIAAGTYVPTEADIKREKGLMRLLGFEN